MPKKTTLVFKKSGPVEVPIPAPIVGDEIVKPQIVEHDVMPRKGIELSAATPGMAGVAPPKEELDRKKKRHEIYDFLASIGAKEMGVGQTNRKRMFDFLNKYAGNTTTWVPSSTTLGILQGTWQFEAGGNVRPTFDFLNKYADVTAKVYREELGRLHRANEEKARKREEDRRRSQAHEAKRKAEREASQT